MTEERHQADDNYDEKIEKMVSLTVSAARGDIPAAQISMTLAQISAGTLAPPEARNLARSLLRILQGERDPIILVEEVTPELAEVVWEALDQIEASPTEVDEEPEEITFEQLIEKAAQACTGEVLLWQRLWDFSEELAANEQNPANIRALGTVLRKILAGERQSHVLDALGSEHRWAVQQLLDWLNERAIEPEQAPNR